MLRGYVGMYRALASFSVNRSPVSMEAADVRPRPTSMSFRLKLVRPSDR